MKHRTKPEIKIMLIFTGLVFFLFLLTMVITNIIILFGVKFGYIADRPAAPILPFLIQSGIISICIGTVLTLIFARLPLRPINILIRAIHQVASGKFDTKIDIRYPQEFRELSESFNQMTEELPGIQMLRPDFINYFSHEFKTPMMSVLGFASLLKKNSLSEEERHEYLDIIISECRRLCALSTNVLNLSKVESMTLLTDITVFNVGEQIRQAIVMLEQKWEKKHISFDLDIRDIIISGNASLLIQVWVNLIDNAVKFSPEHGTIHLRTYSADGQLICTIQDEGPGISPEISKKIFDKFFQGDPSRASEGHGIGLSIVQKIVSLHGGAVDAVSNSGCGSTFTVILPLCAGQAAS